MISVEQRMKRYNMKRGRNEDPTEFSMTVWIEYCNRAGLHFLEGALFMKCLWELQKDEFFVAHFKRD